MDTSSKCPACGSAKVLQIIYGKPTRETMQRAERQEIKLGGCIVTGEDPNRFCDSCHHRWIDTEDAAWIERQELLKRLRKFQDAKKG
jgi:hypothetical protein